MSLSADRFKVKKSYLGIRHPTKKGKFAAKVGELYVDKTGSGLTRNAAQAKGYSTKTIAGKAAKKVHAMS